MLYIFMFNIVLFDVLRICNMTKQRREYRHGPDTGTAWYEANFHK